MASYLQIENISKSYGPKVLFDHIGFNVNEGDKIALIAPNGTGKTSLMRILAGKDKSDSGGQIKFLKEIRDGMRKPRTRTGDLHLVAGRLDLRALHIVIGTERKHDRRAGRRRRRNDGDVLPRHFLQMPRDLLGERTLGIRRRDDGNRPSAVDKQRPWRTHGRREKLRLLFEGRIGDKFAGSTQRGRSPVTLPGRSLRDIRIVGNEVALLVGEPLDRL